MRRSFVAVAALALAGCARQSEKQSFEKLADEFVYTTLANSPVFATSVGYHRHGDVRLDAILDDFSPSSIQGQRRWYQDFRIRLAKSVDPAKLSPDDRADYDILNDQISLALLEFNTIQNYRHNPTLYVELVGYGLYSPFVLEYAAKEERYRHIVGRLRDVPRLTRQARRNLESAPEIWTRVAQEENEGNIGLIERTLRAGCPPALLAEFDGAAKEAVAALRDFNGWMAADLANRPYDWRLGKDRYAQKFRYALATDLTPEQALQAAERQMLLTRQQMYELSRQITKNASGGSIGEEIRRGLNAVSARHATPETYFADARRDLAEAREFVRAKDLLALPPRDNLQVIETPEFMRGIYAVGGFSSAPAFEPHLGAFYWLTPIPATWPKERIESKLREYNYYGLKLLTIHEAMPGHYVQLEYANDVQPPRRRIFRSVFGNGPYIEGWAVYATETMLDEGYLNNDPGLRLTFLKQQLRVFANTILDVRMQTMGMTDKQALDLMIEEGFQEREEAEAKLQRAKLSSAQLPTYFVGWHDWRRLRATYFKGGQGNLKEFHERALKAGAVPVPALARLLTGRALEGANVGE